MKGVAPQDTTMSDIWSAAIPYLLLQVVTMAIIMIFPDTALWLVKTMH
jgi:TRAP-type mannitol/chloroaromatic compound transport system permease large subunit